MRRIITIAFIAMSWILLANRSEMLSADPVLALFDSPRGAWLATVRPDVQFRVLEERDGWRRVSFEGWLPDGPLDTKGISSRGSVVPEGAVPAPSAGVAVSESLVEGGARAAEGATVRGVLLPMDGDVSDLAGAGLIVLLVGDLDLLDREHARAGEACLAAVDEGRAEVERRHDELQKMLNSSDNFREAAARNDRAEAALERAERSLADRIESCRRSADEIFHRHAVQREVSDSAGRFEFTGIGPGNYRVVAREVGGEKPRAWSLRCVVEGTEPVVLDPRHDSIGPHPYWGL